jgi:hypothetical protein
MVLFFEFFFFWFFFFLRNSFFAQPCSPGLPRLPVRASRLVPKKSPIFFRQEARTPSFFRPQRALSFDVVRAARDVSAGNGN